MNPGPSNINNSLSILRNNIRRIRNKFDYLTESFLDFDIFTLVNVYVHLVVFTRIAGTS